MKKEQKIEETAEELSESFLNGNISDVMRELSGMDKFEAMVMSREISKRFRCSSTRQSFERALLYRVDE